MAFKNILGLMPVIVKRCNMKKSVKLTLLFEVANHHCYVHSDVNLNHHHHYSQQHANAPLFLQSVEADVKQYF